MWRRSPQQDGKDSVTHTLSIVCGHVFRLERDVAVVVRHADGGWQFVCGQYDHPEDCADFETVGLEHLVERQANLKGLGELLPGWLAEWTADGWMKTRHDD